MKSICLAWFIIDTETDSYFEIVKRAQQTINFPIRESIKKDFVNARNDLIYREE